MRDLGSGSAVFADADRKPCGEDVFGRVQVTVVACSAVWARPCPDVEFAHTFRSGPLATMGAYLRARIIPVDDDELSPIPFRLVFEHATEFRPSGVQNAFVQTAFSGLSVRKPMFRIVRVRFRSAPFRHVPHLEVFEYNRLVLADDSRTQLMEEVTAHVRDSGVGAGHFESGLPTIVTAFGLTGQRFLFSPQPFGKFPVMTRIGYGLPIAGDGETVHTQVDSDLVLPYRKLSDGLLDQNADMPSSGGVQAYRHGTRLRLAGQSSRPSDWQWLPHFRKCKLIAVAIPFERASSVFGASAVGFGFKSRIISGLFEKVGEGGLQVS